MSITSGQRYRLTNEENGLVLEMYQVPRAENFIFGSKFHGGKKQQWITEKQEDGQWAIQSVSGQKYLGFENTPKDGTPLLGLDKPHPWDIEILSDGEDRDDPRVRLWVRGTLLVVEFSKERSDVVHLELRAARDGKEQVWVLEEYS